MGASKIQIWNMALGWVGTRTVASESERTEEAMQCILYWDNARRQALRDYPFNFAQRRAWLAEIPMLDGYEKDFAHAYALPVDCLKVHKVRHHGQGEQPFSLVLDKNTDAEALMTDADEALALYTADVENAKIFDDLFTYVLARRLAALIAVPLLKNNAAKVSELEQLYRAALPSAREANATEQKKEPEEDSWLTARYL